MTQRIMHKVMPFLCMFLSVYLMSACSSAPGNLFDGGGNIGRDGSFNLPGAMVFDRNTNTYRLSGSGTNMWGTSDEFFMVWRKVSGDFTLSARVAFEGEGVDPHRKMGLIIRKSLDVDAIYADVAVHGDGLTSLQYRELKGADTKEVVSGNTAPEYIILEREGNRIRMKTGNDTWPQTTDGEITLILPEECYVGLFVCSHNPEVIETGIFSEVTLKD